MKPPKAQPGDHVILGPYLVEAVAWDEYMDCCVYNLQEVPMFRIVEGDIVTAYPQPTKEEGAS